MSNGTTVTESDMNRLCQIIDEFLPDNHGFIVFAFPTGNAKDRRARYASNATRETAVPALKEWLIQRGHDEDWMRYHD